MFLQPKAAKDSSPYTTEAVDGSSVQCQLQPDGWVSVTVGECNTGRSNNDGDAESVHRTEPSPSTSAVHHVHSKLHILDQTVLDELCSARVQSGYERERFVQYCRLIVEPLQQLRDLLGNSKDPFARAVKELYDQHCKDTDLMADCSLAVQKAEGEVVRLEDRMFRMSGGSGGQTTPDTATPQRRSPLLDEYFRRAGDARVAAERLTEFDWETAMGRLGRARTPERCTIHWQSQSRESCRLSLERALLCAVDDAEMLEARCIDQGMDPDKVRYRRRSSVS